MPVGWGTSWSSSSVRVDARPATGQPVQPDGEHEFEQQAGEEDRGGVPEDRENPHRRIRPAVTQVGGQHSEWDADEERDDQRVEHQLKGGPAVGEQDFGDRSVVAEGGAEVAGEDLAQVLDVLHEDGPVVAGRVDAFLDLVGAEPAAERCGDRIADGAHQQEHHRDQDEHGRDDQQQSHHDVAAETGRRLLGFRCLPAGGVAGAVSGITVAVIIANLIGCVRGGGDPRSGGPPPLQRPQRL